MRSEFTPGISLKIRFRLQPRSQGLSSSLPLKRKRRGKTLGTGVVCIIPGPTAQLC